MRKVVFSLATFALAAASAASSYSVKFDQPVTIGATELKPGDYKVEMQGDKAVFKSGKNVVEVPATLEKADKKYNYTSFSSEGSKVSEIDLGGTNMRIVFGPASSGKASK